MDGLSVQTSGRSTVCAYGHSVTTYYNLSRDPIDNLLDTPLKTLQSIVERLSCVVLFFVVTNLQFRSR